MLRGFDFYELDVFCSQDHRLSLFRMQRSVSCNVFPVHEFYFSLVLKNMGVVEC